MNTSFLTRIIVLSFLLMSFHPMKSVSSQVSQGNEIEVVESETQQEDHSHSEDSKQNKTAIINFFEDGLEENTLNKLMYVFRGLINVGYNDVLLVIDSSGGDLSTGIAAYNYLSSLPITLRTHNISQVSSAANLIYCAGDIRTASENSNFLLHNGTMTIASNQTLSEVTGAVEQIQMMQQFSRNIISNCTGINDREIEEIFAAESVFDASKAHSLGLVHEVRGIGSEIADADFIIPIELINLGIWPRDF